MVDTFPPISEDVSKPFRPKEWQKGSLVIHDATYLLVCDSQEPARQGVKFLLSVSRSLGL